MPRQTKKCPECNGCMAVLWAPDGKRYFYCDFCRIYYGGGNDTLEIVPNPFIPPKEETEE